MLVDRQRFGETKVSQLDGASIIDEARPACTVGTVTDLQDGQW